MHAHLSRPYHATQAALAKRVVRRLLTVLAPIVLVSVLASAPAHAQFRNGGIQVSAGWLGLGTLVDPLLGPSWNIHDQPTLGAGYQMAIGYNLWFEVIHASIGASWVRISSLDVIEPVFSFSVASGLRYNFLEEKFRPFISGHLHYQHLLAVTENAPIPTNTLLGNAPFWLGVRLGGGVEYFHADEQSLMLLGGVMVFTGLNAPPPGGQQSFVLPSYLLRFSYQVYF